MRDASLEKVRQVCGGHGAGPRGDPETSTCTVGAALRSGYSPLPFSGVRKL